MQTFKGFHISPQEKRMPNLWGKILKVFSLRLGSKIGSKVGSLVRVGDAFQKWHYRPFQLRLGLLSSKWSDDCLSRNWRSYISFNLWSAVRSNQHLDSRNQLGHDLWKLRATGGWVGFIRVCEYKLGNKLTLINQVQFSDRINTMLFFLFNYTNYSVSAALSHYSYISWQPVHSLSIRLF